MSDSDHPEPHEFTLSPAELDASRRKLEKINERAVKRGFTGRFELRATRTTVTTENEAGLPVEHIVYRCTITGETPKYDGWEFLARIDALPAEDGTSTSWLINSAPGVDTSDVDRSALKAGYCDHCKTTRANRRKLMLVRNTDTGEMHQVGTTCIKDFLGWTGTPVWIDLDQVREDLAHNSGSTLQTWTHDTVLAAAHAAIAAYGWVPASSSDGIPTRDRVAVLLHGPRNKRDEELIGEVTFETIEAGIAAAPATRAEALERTAGDTGGYLGNLHAALAADGVDSRSLGLICSTIGYLAREKAKADEQRERDEFTPEWVGEPGEKITFTGIPTTVMVVDSFYGNTSQLLVVIRTENALLKFTTAARWAFESGAIELGEPITLEATVKRHTDYHGAKQTEVKRPRLIPAAAATTTE